MAGHADPAPAGLPQPGRPALNRIQLHLKCPQWNNLDLLNLVFAVHSGVDCWPFNVGDDTCLAGTWKVHLGRLFVVNDGISTFMLTIQREAVIDPGEQVIRRE